jgi:hypothetical protein
MGTSGPTGSQIIQDAFCAGAINMTGEGEIFRKMLRRQFLYRTAQVSACDLLRSNLLLKLLRTGITFLPSK